MPRDALIQLFRQILEGWDIPRAASVLRISAVRASVQIEGMPYSIAENLWHANYWQRLWLDQLDGKKPPPLMQVWKSDWQSPSTSEWRNLRAEFLEGLGRARAIAESEPLAHRCPSDDEAVALLLRIAIHASYHIGQLNLLKHRTAGSAASPDSRSPNR